jgi:hypothetical protein
LTGGAPRQKTFFIVSRASAVIEIYKDNYRKRENVEDMVHEYIGSEFERDQARIVVGIKMPRAVAHEMSDGIIAQDSPAEDAYNKTR